MKPLLVLFAAVAMVFDVTAGGFSAAEKSQIQTIVNDYLLNHPEILLQMSQALQQKALVAIKVNKAALFNPGDTQIAGNPKGSITLVEFFDYQCIHCANLYQQGLITQLIKKNPNLRVVYKTFPILGAASIYATKAAMAANQQGHYLAMHNAILKTRVIEGKLKTQEIDALAKQIGLNMRQYHEAIDEGAFNRRIQQNHQLATALGIKGVPSFVIAPTPKLGNPQGKITFIPSLVGAVPLQRAIDAAK